MKFEEGDLDCLTKFPWALPRPRKFGEGDLDCLNKFPWALPRPWKFEEGDLDCLNKFPWALPRPWKFEEGDLDCLPPSLPSLPPCSFQPSRDSQSFKRFPSSTHSLTRGDRERKANPRSREVTETELVGGGGGGGVAAWRPAGTIRLSPI